MTPGARGRGVRDLVFVGLIQSFSKLRGLILVPLMMRFFGADEYGVWVQIIVTVNLVASLVGLNLHTTLLRYLPNATEAERGSVFWTAAFIVVCTSSAVFSVTALSAPWVAVLAFGVSPFEMILVGALIQIRALWQFCINVPRAGGRPRFFALLEAMPLYAELLALGSVAALGRSPTAALTAMAVVEGSALLVVGAAIARSFSWRRPSERRTRVLLAYALPTAPVSLSNSILAAGDRYLIGAFLGPAAVGLYSAAYAICSITSFFARPLVVSLLPKTSKLWDTGDRDGAGRTLRRHGKVFLFLAVPTAVAVAVLGPPALTLLTGETHTEWSFSLLLTISLGGVLLGMLQVSWHTYLLEGRTRSGMWAFLAGAAINTCANVVLLGWLGILGAGVATMVAYGLVAGWFEWRARVTFGGVFQARSVLAVTTAASVMGCTLALVGARSPIELLASVAAGLGVYVPLALALGLFSRAELASVGIRRADRR